MKFTEDWSAAGGRPRARTAVWPLKPQHSKAGTLTPIRVPARRNPRAVSLTKELPWSHYLPIYQHWQHC